MEIVFKGSKIFYDICGKKSNEVIVFLHGWQTNHESFAYTYVELKKKYQVVLIDFPPFGRSDELQEVWSVKEYAELVKKILMINDITSFSIIAHSFGGRVAIELCQSENVENLVLTGSAGLFCDRQLTKFKVLKFKAKRSLVKLGLMSKDKLYKCGSDDYKNLSGHDRATFVKVVNYNQIKLLKNINVNTLLVWGKNDEQTPIKIANKFNRKIKGSKLVVLNGSHFVFIEKHEKFNELIKEFLERS